MNTQLKTLPDGSGSERHNKVIWFDYLVMTTDGKVSTHQDYGEIYWPFALQFKVGIEDTWTVLHLPSGHAVKQNLTNRQARRLIQRLRALKVNWNFTKPKGPKWDKARQAVKDAGLSCG